MEKEIQTVALYVNGTYLNMYQDIETIFDQIKVSKFIPHYNGNGIIISYLNSDVISSFTKLDEV